jgi:EAL domain-containing protein (putative c-di-GMP-specific phosphodiesterase class I)
MRILEISELGIEFIFTEFGTGYSGIHNILNMPVNAVKLERMLTWQMENDPRGALLLEGLVHTANNLGLKVIAEGVETQNQVDLLEQYGCAYQQGFFYSPTLTAGELVEALQRTEF